MVIFWHPRVTRKMASTEAFVYHPAGWTSWTWLMPERELKGPQSSWVGDFSRKMTSFPRNRTNMLFWPVFAPLPSASSIIPQLCSNNFADKNVQWAKFLQNCFCIVWLISDPSPSTRKPRPKTNKNDWKWTGSRLKRPSKKKRKWMSNLRNHWPPWWWDVLNVFGFLKVNQGKDWARDRAKDAIKHRILPN